MITREQRLALEGEFPELLEPDLVLTKELYAHFGLLFFNFSLVEHSMINTLTFHHVGKLYQRKEIKDSAHWQKIFDDGYAAAAKLTFGNLSRKLTKIEEFDSLGPDLLKAKRSRDYFAHHFFREEVPFYMSDEGCWHLLYELGQVRQQFKQLDGQLRPPFELMCERFKLPRPTSEQLAMEEKRMSDEAARTLRSDDTKFGWQK